MRTVKNHTLSVFFLVTALLLSTASPSGNKNVATMGFEMYWFDLETGMVIPEELPFPGPPTSACDFKFAYNSVFEPHAVIFQNQLEGVEIAYSEEDFKDVKLSDVANLSFTTDLVDIPFDKVAVLHTPEGNYFKVGPVSENYPDFTVTFEWKLLRGSRIQ